LPEARARGLAVVCDGTNADDRRSGEHRPGYAAGERAGIRSPLAEVGMTKAEIRAASRELGLPVWDAPAAPCLSSRVAYGLAITPRRLEQVERAEAYLRELGVTGDLRVRHHGDRGGARIEVEPRWIAWVAERLPSLRAHLALGRGTRDAKPRDFAGLEAALGRIGYTETALVSGVDLMQSTLQSGGAVYHVRHSERLP